MITAADATIHLILDLSLYGVVTLFVNVTIVCVKVLSHWPIADRLGSDQFKCHALFAALTAHKQIQCNLHVMFHAARVHGDAPAACTCVCLIH